MIVLAWIALLGSPLGDWSEALARGAYASAWKEAEALEPDLRARAEAQILYQGGCPADALRAAERGLQLQPDAPELLFYAAGSALWLGEAELALGFTQRLTRSVQAGEWTAEVHQAWERTATSFEARALELGRNETARENALARARAVVISMLGLALMGLARLVRQGRSSKPVS